MAISAADPRSRPDELEEQYGNYDPLARLHAQRQSQRDTVLKESHQLVHEMEEILAAAASR